MAFKPKLIKLINFLYHGKVFKKPILYTFTLIDIKQYDYAKF